ncbi:TRAP transporter small permease [Desulforamulus aquiferis]|uniref:TRAP transporter small permease n=1 Tax=Desulforamulus aquiferis TaxID=1397668 RepID=A0AAW7ZDT1_9FIRM|nr:TRAP transporter small permease [Desulforamulus aquiferis]MDO7787593.1 TRAP transporter small permease [Desulforamulus aquiferis]RYD01420.1 hypothetical protein N752_30975 [Desulforamulus aquiferis]
MRIFKLVVNNIEEIIASVLFCTVITLLFIQVIARYVFGTGIAWSEELLRFAFLTMVYFAAALGAKQGAHFRVTLLVNILPGKFKKVLEIIQYVISFAFNGFVIYLGFKVIYEMKDFPQISPILSWDMRYVYAMVPIAFVFVTVRMFIRMLTDFGIIKDKTA